MEKILLLNLNWRNMQKVGRMDKNTPVVPLEYLYISAALDRKQIGNDFVDLWALNKELKDIDKQVANSEIIVLNSAPSYVFWRDGTLETGFPKKGVTEVRKLNPNAKIILIGPHATVKPSDFFEEKIDFIIRGEPDLVTAELIEAIMQKKDFSQLQGVCYKKENSWTTSKEANVDNLHDLPVLPFEKVNLKLYNWPPAPAQINSKLSAGYEASRGCIYDCTFCFREGFRGKFRLKSFEQVEAELEKLRVQGVDYIYFIDEIFAVDRNWTKRVCEIATEKGIKWGCQTRPHLMNKEKITFYAQHNCARIEMGLETVNTDILRNLDKLGVNPVSLKECVNEMIAQNIRPTLFCIIGSPGETKASIKEMLNYLKQLPLDEMEVNIDIMMPYPDTKLWKQAKEHGIKLNEWSDVEKYVGIVENDFSSTKEIKTEFVKFLNSVSKEKRKRELVKQLKTFKLASFITALKLAKCQALIFFPPLNDFIDKLKA